MAYQGPSEVYPQIACMYCIGHIICSFLSLLCAPLLSSLRPMPECPPIDSLFWALKKVSDLTVFYMKLLFHFFGPEAVRNDDIGKALPNLINLILVIFKDKMMN